MSRTLRDERGLRIFGKSVLRGILGLRRRTKWRKEKMAR
jgi:hypothetical protein